MLRQAGKNIRNETIVEKENEDSEGDVKQIKLKTPVAPVQPVAKKEVTTISQAKEETKKPEPVIQPKQEAKTEVKP